MSPPICDNGPLLQEFSPEENCSKSSVSSDEPQSDFCAISLKLTLEHHHAPNKLITEQFQGHFTKTLQSLTVHIVQKNFVKTHW